MEMDLDKKTYDLNGYKVYIYGSAEVIGLMCLRIFCENDDALYKALLPMACSLGAAFQKVNFLRDIKADFEERGRVYFPGVDFRHFKEADKKEIEADIKADFDQALVGIKLLPAGTKLGVYVAYNYYLRLFKKIKQTPASQIMQKRIRISDAQKRAVFCKALVIQKLQIV